MRAVVAALAVTAIATVMTPVSSAEPDFTGIDGGALAAQWTAAHDGPQPFDGIDPELGVPITMSDGTVLRGDIFHPMRGGRRADGPTPVVLQLQGYSKLAVNIAQLMLKIPGIEQVLLPWIASLNFPGSGLDGITDLTRQLDAGVAQVAAGDWALVNAGYTVVHVDIRGTGVSNGRWQIFGEQNRKDASEIADWISAQPWSDGKIGLVGMSFNGINAMQAASSGNPAFRSVFAYVPSQDVVSEIGLGGAVSGPFLAVWLLAVNMAKLVPDVESFVSGRFDPVQQLQWLTDRIADPATFADVLASAYTSLTTDQVSGRARDFMNPNSALRRGLEVDPAAITAPSFVVAANTDIFAATQLVKYRDSPLPPQQKKIIYGDGVHLGAGVAGFGHPGMPPRLDVLQRAWFDKWLKGIDNGIENYSPMTIAQPDGPWTTATQFPRPGVEHRRMYLTGQPSGTAPTALADGSLSPEPAPAPRDFTVAPGLLSICSRDTAMASAGVSSIIVACTEDSRIREREGLTFTSDAVTEPTVISGPVAVHLNTVHDTRDGYWTVTVNDVSPDGRSRQLSTGQLVSSLRQIDDSRSERSADGEYTRPMPYTDLSRREPWPRASRSPSISPRFRSMPPCNRAIACASPSSPPTFRKACRRPRY